MTSRYAVYAAPEPGSPLHERASRWLGRDAAAGTAWHTPPFEDLDATDWRHVTADPRLYGFHATLKPPMRLAAGRTLARLESEMLDFALTQAPVSIALTVGELSGFLALRPEEDWQGVQALADAAVQALDRFRALPDDREIARRRQAGLTARQERHLERWGYPYVLEDFRLHFTLSGRLGDDRRSALMPRLAEWFAPALLEPFRLDRLWLFEQPAAGAPFRQLRAFLLRG